LYLLGADAIAMAGGGTVLLMDRVWHNSTMSGTATGTNTITQPALPARITDDGAELRLGLEVFTSWGTTARTLTITYRDADDAADRTTTLATTVPGGSGAPIAGTFVQLPLANNRGVKKVVSYGWDASTGTAGNFGLVVCREIARIQVAAAGVTVVSNYAITRLPTILSDSCLFLAWVGTSTSATVITGNLTVGEG
jgi:hypothetical protein